MKKLLLITGIVILAACNEKADKAENTVDSKADAISDSLENKVDNLGVSGDSTKKYIKDTLHKRND